MVRELLMKSWCDQCWRESEARIEATVTRTVAIDGHPALLIELCDDHGPTVTTVLAMVELLGTPADQQADDGARPRRGRPTTPVAPGAESYPCPICDHYVGTSAKLRNQHMARQHGATYGQWRRGETGRR